ncbi:hypothetical protein GCM10009634_78250 [Saccharothrix xinjiangensis]
MSISWLLQPSMTAWLWVNPQTQVRSEVRCACTRSSGAAARSNTSARSRATKSITSRHWSAVPTPRRSCRLTGTSTARWTTCSGTENPVRCTEVRSTSCRSTTIRTAARNASGSKGASSATR